MAKNDMDGSMSVRKRDMAHSKLLCDTYNFKPWCHDGNTWCNISVSSRLFLPRALVIYLTFPFLLLYYLFFSPNKLSSSISLTPKLNEIFFSLRASTHNIGYNYKYNKLCQKYQQYRLNHGQLGSKKALPIKRRNFQSQLIQLW